MNATARQAAFTLLTIVVHDRQERGDRLDLLNATILQDLNECDTDEARGSFLMDMAAHLSIVAAGLAQAVADLHKRPVEDLLATLAAVELVGPS